MPTATDAPTSDPALAEAEGVLRARVVSRIADVMGARTRLGDARGAETDEEAVHDYRVALRRLRTALRALRRTWGKQVLLPLELELKALADATGDVRDEEVLAETLGDLAVSESCRGVLDRWCRGRQRRLRGAQNLAARRLASDTLGSRLSAALVGIERALAAPATRRASLSAIRADVLSRMLADVVRRSLATREDDATGLHTLRIRIKRLRYAIELLFDGDDRRHAALKVATRLQKRLGELHDLDEALVRMRRAWGLDGAARDEVLAALGRERRKQGRKAQVELAELVPKLTLSVERALDAKAHD